MFRNKNPQIEKPRHVVMHLKTTGLKPEEGDRITQLACVEMKDGQLTGNNLDLHIKPGQSFADAQQQLLSYLAQDKDTRIIVHYKKFVLDFLRSDMSAEGVEQLNGYKMENMISKVAKLGHQGKYHAGLYPKEINKDSDRLEEGKTRKTFNDVCEELDVHTRTRTGKSAMQDADMLARAERNRLMRKSEGAQSSVSLRR